MTPRSGGPIIEPVTERDSQAPRAPKGRPLTRCPKCGFLLDLALPDCRHCGEPLPADPQEPPPEEETKPKRASGPRRFIPVGLVVTLAVYGVLVQLFLSYQYYSAPEYQAALRLHEAQELLGSDDGRTASRENLTRALDLSLEAASLVPSNTWAQKRAEITLARMRERDVEIPIDLRRKMDFVGAKWREIQDDQASVFPIGARDLWDVDAVLAAPRIVLKVAMILGVAIALAWGYFYYQELRRRRLAEDKRLALLKEDLRQLNSHRRMRSKA